MTLADGRRLITAPGSHGLLLAMAFVTLCGPTSALLSLSMPSWFFADELPHIIRANSVAKGELLARRELTDLEGNTLMQAGVDADHGLVKLGKATSPNAQTTGDVVARILDIGWDDIQFVAIPNTA